MARHRARKLLGCGVLWITENGGKRVKLPLRPELLAMVAALNTKPLPKSLAHRQRRITILAR
jgi:hypothetical protein